MAFVSQLILWHTIENEIKRIAVKAFEVARKVAEKNVNKR